MTVLLILEFSPNNNAIEATYTIGIDREEIFLFCNSSNSSISLTDIKWRVTGNNRTFPNPLIPHSNMLLQNGTSYNIQCVDIGTNRNINHIRYTVQGKLFKNHTYLQIHHSIDQRKDAVSKLLKLNGLVNCICLYRSSKGYTREWTLEYYFSPTS